ncbi:putative transcription regulator protein [Collimonas arenae]|uniref:Putative transcription regulator protein n=2 Tax=Collimonas arenae TaxID=279058 RepID=A0A0A1FF34_9BURK|nr:putative transcription regulator protein [Collimonas arenae]
MARVIAAIVAEPMAQHSLEGLAGIANFSPFHFHRLYRGMMGETVAATIRRLRLAHAASLLMEGKRSITDIALETGYDSPQAFTRAFRSFSGSSPRGFRQKIGVFAGGDAGGGATQDQPGFDMHLLEREPMRIHALPHSGPLATIPYSHRRLRTLVGSRPVQQWLGVCYGDPEANDDFRDFRYYAAAVLPAEPLIADGVGIMDIPGGLYAVHTLMGPYTQIGPAINTLYSAWLPGSGYEPDDRPLLECYRNNPRMVAPEELRTDLLIPIRLIAHR